MRYQVTPDQIITIRLPTGDITTFPLIYLRGITDPVKIKRIKAKFSANQITTAQEELNHGQTVHISG